MARFAMQPKTNKKLPPPKKRGGSYFGFIKVKRYQHHTIISFRFRKNSTRKHIKRHEKAYNFGAGIILLALSLSGVAFVASPYVNAYLVPTPSVLPTFVSTKRLGLPRSLPTTLQIPAINLTTSVIQTDKDANGELTVPGRSDAAAWYAHSPTPGEVGPSVIVGHLDTVLGSAVFANLSKVPVGSQVRILRTDGSTAKFKVEAVSNFPQDSFPTSAVYGKLNYPGLRLITCGGVYNLLKGRYSDNTIVYASLVQ